MITPLPVVFLELDSGIQYRGACSIEQPTTTQSET